MVDRGGKKKLSHASDLEKVVLVHVGLPEHRARMMITPGPSSVAPRVGRRL